MNVESVLKVITQHVHKVTTFYILIMIQPLASTYLIKVERCVSHVPMVHIALETILFLGLTIGVTGKQMNCCSNSARNIIVVLEILTLHVQYIILVPNIGQVLYVDHVRMGILFQF